MQENALFSSLSLRRRVFPLRLAFAHHNASRAAAETLLVAIRTRSGAAGYGQCLPREYLTGETLEGAEVSIRGTWFPALREMRLPEAPAAITFETLLSALAPVFEKADALRQNAAYAAAECAAVDALLRERGFPAAPPDCFAKPPLPLTATIPLTGPRKAHALALLLRALGYGGFKVKLSRDRAADDARLLAVRRAVGKDARLLADANGAWTPEEAAERIPPLKNFGVALIEEPLRRGADGSPPAFDYRRLEHAAGVAVMADESLCTLADARALIANGSPSWWNLRFAKNGGFSGLAALSALAREAGAKVHAGVLVGETGVLASAGRSGAFLMNAKSAEYGFSRVFLRGDPFRGSPAGYGGLLFPPSRKISGLGVRIRKKNFTGE